MISRSRSFLFIGVIVAGGFVVWVASGLGARASAVVQQPPPSPGERQIGSVKSIQENTLVLVTDKGPEVQVFVEATARLLRAEPGQTDLKTAVPIEFREIQAGDRVLVRGKPSGDGQSLTASLVVAIKKAAIERKHSNEQEDWQKRGLRGLVKQVDPAAHTITITTSALTGRKPVIIRISPRTILRRYAPTSVRFEDAKLGAFEEIRPGDQFRGRGNRSADGSEFGADEIITGSFRSIAGTVSFAETDKKTLTIADLITKSPIMVRITDETSMRKLPEMMAEGIARRLGGGPPSGPPNGAFPRGGGHAPPPPRPAETAPPGNGTTDFQQLIAQLPAASLADFPKGEAVMIVATSGNNPGEAIAINLLGGVEPLLRASPEGSQEMMLSPWSLGGPAPEGQSQ